VLSFQGPLLKSEKGHKMYVVFTFFCATCMYVQYVHSMFISVYCISQSENLQMYEYDVCYLQHIMYRRVN